MPVGGAYYVSTLVDEGIDEVGGKGAEFRVGTGFTAAVRAELWDIRDELAGRIAKIKSFPVGTKDRPRHPVWLGWRDLKVDG